MIASLEGADKFHKLLADSMYTSEERAKFSRIIREFNELFYSMNKQTWCATQWRGVHAFKAATDLWIYQELIHAIQPDCIIETGTLFGGSALFLADICRLDGLETRIISIDISHERLTHKAKAAPITFLLGSSIDSDIIKRIAEWHYTEDWKKVMVILDSEHTKEHVLKELELYAPFVSVGSVLIVEDTNNHPGPKAAIEEWLPLHSEFQPDYMCEKLMLTFNKDGYLERVK